MSANQTSPNAKIASARVPEVPDKYVNQPFSGGRLVGQLLSYPFILVLLILCIVLGLEWWTSIPDVQIDTAPSASTPDVPVDCPNQPPPPSDGQPALFFCSPIYSGNVAGPFGARVVLVGENFPSSPTKWFLPKRPVKKRRYA